MTDEERPEDTGAEVGSLADEAARLLGALSTFARAHGADVGDGLGAAAGHAADGLRDVNEHLATGAPGVHLLPDLPGRARRPADLARGAGRSGGGLRIVAPGCGRAARDRGARRASLGRRPWRGHRAHRPGRRVARGRPRMSLTIGVDVGGHQDRRRAGRRARRRPGRAPGRVAGHRRAGHGGGDRRARGAAGGRPRRDRCRRGRRRLRRPDPVGRPVRPQPGVAGPAAAGGPRRHA